MFILDTNVLSEILKPTPDAGVLAWMSAQPRSQLFTTVITRAEMLYGISLLPDSPRRKKLKEAALAIFNEDLEDKVLVFDVHAADRYSEIAARRRAAGKPITQFDAMIAAIAHLHQAQLVTRNVKDFIECDVGVCDPWCAA